VIEDRLNILFVDDDPILREFAGVHLSSDKVSVTVAEDGLDALEKMRAAKPDILLLDLEMPNMDGFQLLETMSKDQELAGLPVVVVTGREDVMAIDRAYQAGATSFVVKPLNWRQISYQVRYVHRTHGHEQQIVAERDRAEQAAKEARRKLTAVAQESSNFLAAALARYPDLRASAAKYAAELSAALRG
jgi:DNA-binding response OmpR family regulator